MFTKIDQATKPLPLSFCFFPQVRVIGPPVHAMTGAATHVFHNNTEKKHTDLKIQLFSSKIIYHSRWKKQQLLGY